MDGKKALDWACFAVFVFLTNPEDIQLRVLRFTCYSLCLLGTVLETDS